MSHFGRAGPPDISDTYSLLVLNISFRTSADDLYPLFEKYGKVVDVFIPRDRRTGDSRGFAFVRYKHADEAQRAVEHLDGRNVDGRDIMVQFAKYGPNAEVIHKGRVSQDSFKQKAFRRSPQRSRYRDDSYRDRDYYRERDNHRDRDYHRDREYHRNRNRNRNRSRSRSRSRSRDRYGRYRGREKDYKPSSRSANRSHSRSRSSSPDYSHHHRRLRRSRTRSGSPSSRLASLERHQSPQKRSPVQSASPNDRQSPSHSPISGKSDNNEG